MPLRRKIRSGYIITFILLMISYFFIFQSTWRLQREYDWIERSAEAENKIIELRYLVVEAESSVRGYYITKDDTYLSSYNVNREKIPSVCKEIKEHESDNPEQLNTLDTIKFLIEQRLELIKKNLELFQFAGSSTPEIDSNRKLGRVLQDKIRLKTEEFIATEKKLMNKRKSNLSGSFGTAQLITFISLLTSIIAIFYSLYTYNRESKARDESTRKNSLYQKELEKHIEELKKMDAEVRELKSLEKFTSTGRIARTIAHEVRNPLTNITLATEQLQEASGNNESSMLLDMITRNTIRINQLVSDLLNATKVMELDIKKVDINTLLDETLQIAADRLELHNIKVEKKYSPGLCDVAIDAEKIKIALLNIIVNAIEAMEKDKGLLKIRTRRENNLCVIEIEDNGTGMDEDTLQKLFEPYFTSKPKGNGLGLTNSQNIILSHRGKITVQSEPGKGSKFVIILQLAD